MSPSRLSLVMLLVFAAGCGGNEGSTSKGEHRCATESTGECVSPEAEACIHILEEGGTIADCQDASNRR